MPFPKNQLLPNTENPLLSDMLQKRIGFSPLVLCEFYEGFEVLQIQGNESKEYFFGNYFNGKYCGHIYFGEKYTQIEAAKLCNKFMPKNWDQIQQYVNDYGSEVWYWKFHQSQYAFLLQNVLQKIEK